MHIPVLDNQQPQLKDLQILITKHCTDWKDIGQRLGLEDSVIKQVEYDYRTARECFRAILERWLDLKVGVTWGNLELAITNANRVKLGYQPLEVGKYVTLCMGVSKETTEMQI